jgi:cytochrome c oxidase accessory protein FixG
MCPYARFQGAMFDRGTMIVSYDRTRGEPRGARSKTVNAASLGLGACVDCNLCVQVCPTGIDIRKGLQYECIACAACVDVCNTVMDKMNYPRDLIAYAQLERSSNKLLGAKRALATALRPRNLVYAVLWVALVLGLSIGLIVRHPLRADVVRDRAGLARLVSGGQVENVYRIQLMNALEEPMPVSIRVSGLPGISLQGETTVTLRPTEAKWVVVRVRAPQDAAAAGAQRILFELAVPQRAVPVLEKASFYLPR